VALGYPAVFIAALSLQVYQTPTKGNIAPNKLRSQQAKIHGITLKEIVPFIF